jgi:uncharacterized protein
VEYTKVSFNNSDGIVLRGRHYPAVGTKGRAPIVVMAHGFGGVIELRLDSFAEAFSAAGINVLAYDHHGFGVSDGLPRQECDPYRQITDWRDAITFAQTLPGVDPDRLGVYGSSYCGGHVIVLGATDHRVKCVVSQLPFISGSQTMIRNMRPDQLVTTQAMFAADRTERMQGQKPKVIPIVTNDPTTPAAMALPEAYDWTMKNMANAPTYVNEITVRSLEMAGAYEPGHFIRQVSPTPLMMIVGTRDVIATPDLALDAFDRALEPKKLVLLDCGHFEPYDKYFEETAGAATNWFLEKLGKTK